MLTIKEKQDYSGVGWFRNINGKNTTFSEALTAFSEKYFYVAPDFYNQLNFNTIKGLDVIKDILILETPSAFLIEKFEIINDLPYPKNYDNNLTEFSELHKIDYWYDEILDEIITFEIKKEEYVNNLNKFEFIVKNFDSQNGEYTRKESFNFYISGENLSAIDAFKMCYNPDTNIYNMNYRNFKSILNILKK
jgi:hypothetical protein